MFFLHVCILFSFKVETKGASKLSHSWFTVCVFLKSSMSLCVCVCVLHIWVLGNRMKHTLYVLNLEQSDTLSVNRYQICLYHFSFVSQFVIQYLNVLNVIYPLCKVHILFAVLFFFVPKEKRDCFTNLVLLACIPYVMLWTLRQKKSILKCKLYFNKWMHYSCCNAITLYLQKKKKNSWMRLCTCCFCVFCVLFGGWKKKGRLWLCYNLFLLVNTSNSWHPYTFSHSVCFFNKKKKMFFFIIYWFLFAYLRPKIIENKQ